MLIIRNFQAECKLVSKDYAFDRARLIGGKGADDEVEAPTLVVRIRRLLLQPVVDVVGEAEELRGFEDRILR